jgi:hypothetical protein
MAAIANLTIQQMGASENFFRCSLHSEKGMRKLKAIVRVIRTAIPVAEIGISVPMHVYSILQAAPLKKAP